MASVPIISWQIDGGKVKTVTDFFSWAQESLQMVTAAMKESADKPRQNIKKQRYHFSDKVPYNQSMVFPVDVSGCEIWIIKKPESQRIDAFKLWC